MDEVFPGGNTPETQEVAQPAEPVLEQPQELIEVQDATDADSSRVEDVDTAWDMAHAGKKDRDKAAEIRQKTIPNLTEAYITLPEAALDIRLPSEQKMSLDKELHKEIGSDEDSTNRRQELLDEKEQLEESVERLLSTKSPEVRTALKVIFNEFYKYGIKNNFDELVEKRRQALLQQRGTREGLAEHFDANAETLEQWAEILHDYPISEAFKERFGLGDVTPQILARLESQIKAQEQKIDEDKKNIYKRVASDWSYMGNLGIDSSQTERSAAALAGSLAYTEDLHPNRIADFAYEPGSVEYLEYKRTMDDPQIPVETKKAAYMEAFDRFVLNTELEFKLKKTFLEDIRTGRASQWQ